MIELKILQDVVDRYEDYYRDLKGFPENHKLPVMSKHRFWHSIQAAKALLKTRRWHEFDDSQEETWPTQPGLYAVMIAGDSESLDGHVLYQYPDYQTTATLHEKDEEGHRRFQGVHDEEAFMMFAWYGPIAPPKCDVP